MKTKTLLLGALAGALLYAADPESVEDTLANSLTFYSFWTFYLSVPKPKPKLKPKLNLLQQLKKQHPRQQKWHKRQAQLWQKKWRPRAHLRLQKRQQQKPAQRLQNKWQQKPARRLQKR